MIIDASALLAIAFAEPEARRMLDVLTRAALSRVPSSAWLEAAMVVDRRGDARAPALFADLIARLALDIVPVTAAHAQIARHAWQAYGRGRHQAGLNFGDCLVYAVAKSENAPLLFKGNDFIHTDLEPALKP